MKPKEVSNHRTLVRLFIFIIYYFSNAFRCCLVRLNLQRHMTPTGEIGDYRVT